MPPPWSLLTSHATVLAVIHRDPTLRLADIAAACGLTTRQVTNVIRDLVDSGLLIRERDGRRNVYRVPTDGDRVQKFVSVPDLARLLEIAHPQP